ncbi:MAG: DNA mismatch repair protein MutS [Cellulosilyticaceae bacterium]
MNVTPMMRQYFEIKDQNPDCILFFRLGDFYEMFFDDALTASRELEITLTGRDCGQEERAPMCGVPFHAADNYIARLVEKGYKVAVCEQVEDPKVAKGIVKREVIRIITPGTILEGNTIEEGKNNYIASVIYYNDCYSLSVADVSTGEWQVTEIEGHNSLKKLLDELAKFTPAQCLLDQYCYNDTTITKFISSRFNCLTEETPEHMLDVTLSESALTKHFNIKALEGIGLTTLSASTLAAASLLNYLKETQKNNLSHMRKLTIYNVEEYMLLDGATRRNLELTETLREKKRKGSLLWVLDHTKTAMGARFLRRAIEQPLINAGTIKVRLEATEELKENPFLKEELIDALNQVYDIERLMGRIAYGTCNAKDLVALKQSLGVLPQIHKSLKDCHSQKLKQMYLNFDLLEDVYGLIDQAINEDAPISVREGSLICDGYHEEVDHLRSVKTKGTDWLRDVETKEKEKTGIKNLKIKYNKVFGYFLEVTSSYNHLVPDYFIRKQTLANCERYITEELKKIEEEVLGADDKLTTLEYSLFVNVREQVAKEMERLLATSRQLAELDMLSAFADVAYKNNYVKPMITQDDTINIVNGRHPVVEKIIGEHTFIANDLYLDNKESQINLITGPNMAGKSTFMRQVALVVLMAQIGSFVPADEATIGVVDRIFTRVGASDDLASGQSTFMVEMMEVSNILHNATSNSLLILDEIGRGTSTIDGLSIAWSIIEHLANPKLIGAKTLFATHYHELTVLANTIPTLKNYCVAVKEMGEDIIFLHKIVPGSTDHSYGIQVAKLAGLPENVLKRAKEIMQNLENTDKLDVGRALENEANEPNESVKHKPVKHEATKHEAIVHEPVAGEKAVSKQIDLFSMPYENIIEELRSADIMDMTPMKAMQFLYELQKKVK